MSTITNEPILLDETGKAMLERMDRQNALLAMMAEGKRSEAYSSVTQIANLVRGGTLEENKRLFPIGDQIVIPWKDMDDPKHNTDETAYQVAWDIVRHGEVELRDGSVVPGMYIQMHPCSAYGVQFSHQEAFMNCHEGLAAGTYFVTFGSSWGSKGATAGSSWQFTLTQNVPAGGRLSGFESLPDVAPSTWKVKSWAKPDSADPIEIVEVTEGSEGTDLGTMPYTMLGETGLNCMQCVGYGRGRWSISAMRQYLNKSGDNWWASQTDFDIRPDQYAKKGFMTGFDAEFLNAIKPIKVTTALNTVEGYENATEDTFDTFFLPSLEQMNVTPQLSGVEGVYFEYWRRRLGLSKFAGYHPNIYDAFKIPALNSSSPQHVRLRSANRGFSLNTWYVSSSGFVKGSGDASSAFRFSPVCVIC